MFYSIKKYSCVSIHTHIYSVKAIWQLLMLCIVFLFLLNVKNSFSQPVGDFWDISGNSNLIETSRLGSDNDMPINFVTNNQLRMRLMPDGKFGIGLENPQHTLHIHSNEMINTNDISFPSDNTSVRGINLATSYAYNAIQITNFATEKDKYDGLLIGLKDKNAFINLQEKANMMFSTENKYRMTILSNGNVGIGTSSPQAKLHVFDGNIQIENPSVFWTSENWHVILATPLGSAWRTTDAASTHGKYLGFGQTTSGWYWIMSDANDDTQPAEYPMSLSVDANSNAQLTVCGIIKSAEWIIDIPWWDCVFDKDYKRMTWKEKEKFYLINKHLPKIASAKEIKANGLKSGETMEGMILNIEENRLDITDLYKLIIEQNKEINKLKNELYKLKN